MKKLSAFMCVFSLAGVVLDLYVGRSDFLMKDLTITALWFVIYAKDRFAELHEKSKRA